MPRPKSLFLKLGCLFFFISSAAFSSNSVEGLKSNSPIYKFQDSVSHSEKVYIHFDKPYYASGETIWFKTYLVSANTNRPNAKSKVVHVELVNSENAILKSRIIKISQGGGEGEFYLPKRLPSGEYKIRAYTNFMRNFDDSYFFLKRIQIGSTKSLTNDSTKTKKDITKNKKTSETFKPDLQFFPEGGYMVINQTIEVGFKATDSDGKSIAISGSILDSNNKEILTFRTQKFGLGRILFSPKRNESYKAIINYQGRTYTYKLPEPLKKGVTMKVVERADSYQIRLQSSLSNGVDQLILAGIQNGTVVNVAQLIGNKKIGTINVPKNTLKQGIAQFIISDKNQKPLCERLVFIETDKFKKDIQIASNKTTYNKRELVTLNLELDSIDQANMSLSVTDVSVVNADSFGLDIRSHLLLNSELKGEIEQPGYYFESKNNDRKQQLDLLMLTQGWRQFLWNHVDKRTDKKEFTHETGIRLTGIIQDKSKQRDIVGAEVSLIYDNKDQLVEAKTRSLKNGKFLFGDYDFNDSTKVIIQTKLGNRKRYKKAKIALTQPQRGNQKQNKNADYFIKIEAPIPPSVNFEKSSVRKQKYVDGTIELINTDYISRSRVTQLNPLREFEEDYEQLDVANVKGYRKREKVKEKFKNRYSIYPKPTYRIDFDEVKTFGTNNVLAALQGKVPGLILSGNIQNPMSWIVTNDAAAASTGANGAQKVSDAAGITIQSNYSISLRNGSPPPLILLDNIEVQDLSGILALDISHVDILKGPSAAIFGSRAMGGVLSIHTKRGSDNIEKPKKQHGIGIINFIHPGYYTARKFYQPNYATKKSAHSKFDARTTIHWKPTIKFDNNKNVRIDFYTADVEATYRIDLQGVSNAGVPIKKELYIDVK